MAKDELVSAGVKLDYVKYSDKPTCLAIISLRDSGSASYEFVITNTATFDVGVASGLTAYRPYFLGANNSVAAYIGVSAEL
jgi:hypothetical protein